jgi:hypothetical protein
MNCFRRLFCAPPRRFERVYWVNSPAGDDAAVLKQLSEVTAQMDRTFEEMDKLFDVAFPRRAD